MPSPHRALTSLLASGPTPRLRWDGNGEHLELSGRVCATWASKIGGLLQEEGADGGRVLLDLPPHWRGATWVLGAWLVGAAVVVPDGAAHLGHAAAGVERQATRLASGCDLVVTMRPAAWLERPDRTGATIVGVPVPSFALRLPDAPGAPDLRTSVLDGAADVAAQPDELAHPPEVPPQAPALSIGERTWTFQQIDDGQGEHYGARAVRTWASGGVVDISAA